jgi:hypothetical protein
VQPDRGSDLGRPLIRVAANAMNGGMTDPGQKRAIGVVPPHEARYKKYLDELRDIILPSWRILPATRFYKLSYERLLTLSAQGVVYDIVLASRMQDEREPDLNNIYHAALELRRRGRQTIFIISFHDLLARVRGEDVEAAKRRLALFGRHELDPKRPPLGGIIRTTSTDPLFLISIIADVLEDPGRYLAQNQVYHIETQAHFLNHPPEHTLYGMTQ